MPRFFLLPLPVFAVAGRIPGVLDQAGEDHFGVGEEHFGVVRRLPNAEE